MDENRNSVGSRDPSARDTFAAICTAAVAAVIFWTAVLTAMLLVISIMAGLVFTHYLAPDIAGVAFAALCIWLAVRLVNRRDRWAKWTAVAAAIVVLTYLLCAGLGQIVDYYFGGV